MSGLWPTAAERQSLSFLLPLPNLPARFLLAGGCFAVGLAGWCLSSQPRWTGLALVLVGHLPLWVRTQTTAPGGATPQHEEMWAPVEETWYERLAELESRGKAWDASPWDLTSGRGCLLLLAVLAAVVVAATLLARPLGSDSLLRWTLAALALAVPLWLNGIRTTWNPTELRQKGEALEEARHAAEEGGKDFDVVPLLALREGRRGKYPVDAKLMLRPGEEGDDGFLGVQVQVAMNNVRGRDYPYLYCVVLGKKGFQIPAAPQRGGLVFERGGDTEVDYMVVRQYADNSGGWHTGPGDIRRIVGVALELARQARKAHREGAEE